MGQSQDSTTQSQELTDEQKETLRTQRETVANNVCNVFDSICSVGDKAERAKMHSSLLSDLVGREGLTNETVFRRMLNNYPYSIEHEVVFEGLEYEIADNYSTEHEVSTSVSVGDTHVDIDVTVDLHNEVYHGPSIELSKEVSLDGCDIIASYMEAAGTEDPVFFLAKVAELLMEGVESKARGDVATELSKQYEALIDAAKETERDLNAIIAKLQAPQDDLLRDALNAKEELTIAFNKMQDRVFALTDIMKDILTDEPISISDVLNDAVRNYGLESTK